MFKNSSSIDLTPISSRKSSHISKSKPFCPSLFLNSIDSLPKKFEEQQKEKERALELEMPDDIIVPKTVRRRHVLGNSDSPKKSEQILPNLPHFSLHLSSSRKLIEDLHQFQEAETQRESYKFENINQRIRQIINSNKRQVSFQSQLVIIDDKDKSQIVSELPTIRENTKRKKTHFKHLTTEI